MRVGQRFEESDVGVAAMVTGYSSSVVNSAAARGAWTKRHVVIAVNKAQGAVSIEVVNTNSC